MRTCYCSFRSRQGHAGGIITTSKQELPAGLSSKSSQPHLFCMQGARAASEPAHQQLDVQWSSRQDHCTCGGTLKDPQVMNTSDRVVQPSQVCSVVAGQLRNMKCIFCDVFSVCIKHVAVCPCATTCGTGAAKTYNKGSREKSSKGALGCAPRSDRKGP